MLMRNFIKKSLVEFFMNPQLMPYFVLTSQLPLLESKATTLLFDSGRMLLLRREFGSDILFGT